MFAENCEIYHSVLISYGYVFYYWNVKIYAALNGKI